MFDALPPSDSHRLRSLLISTAVHGLVLFLLFRPQAVVVTGARAAFGNHGTSSGLTLLFSPRRKPQAKSYTTAQLHTPRNRRPAPKTPPPRETAPTQMAESNQFTVHTGTLFGSALKGPDYDETPALPIVFPDIPRSEIPPDAQGNVVVEIVIDAEGNVVETRVLESLGPLIDDAAVRTLRQWHFRPAIRNGVPIASKQHAYFHLPR